MADAPRYWAVVPAAGVGSRMAAAVPKQYLVMHDKTVLETTLSKLSVEPIAATYLALSANDAYAADIDFSQFSTPIHRVTGGAERADSVFNALHALRDVAADDDWVLVHDAARPGLPASALRRLLTQVGEHPVGGILAMPMVDTVKQVNGADIVQTVDRNQYWAAQTPQLFRVKLLYDALAYCLKEALVVTDEASAIEQFRLIAGGSTAMPAPCVVEGAAANFKITRPGDLALAAWFATQEEATSST